MQCTRIVFYSREGRSPGCEAPRHAAPPSSIKYFKVSYEVTFLHLTGPGVMAISCHIAGSARYCCPYVLIDLGVRGGGGWGRTLLGSYSALCLCWLSNAAKQPHALRCLTPVTSLYHFLFRSSSSTFAPCFHLRAFQTRQHIAPHFHPLPTPCIALLWVLSGHSAPSFWRRSTTTSAINIPSYQTRVYCSVVSFGTISPTTRALHHFYPPSALALLSTTHIITRIYYPWRIPSLPFVLRPESPCYLACQVSILNMASRLSN